MTTEEQQKNIDHLAIIISNYIGETNIGFENIAVLDGLFESLHISSNLKNWWNARISKALQNTRRKN